MATKHRLPQVNISDAQLLFRNFAGKEAMYNPKGRRNFCVVLDDDLAEKMAADGWNVKYLKPREPGDEPKPYIKVNVAYHRSPPRITLLAGPNQELLTEETVALIDYADIKMVDLTITPYHWEQDDGRSGVSAYLKVMYVTIIEDVWAAKYREDVPYDPDADDGYN